MIKAFLTFMVLSLLPGTAGAAATEEAVTVAQGRQPQGVVDSQGAAWVTFARENTIWLTRSTDGGATWQEPRKVAEVPATDVGMRRGPRVAVADGALLVSTIAGEQARGQDGDLLLWRSEDDGQTWQGPATLNSAQASAREGLHSMAASGRHVALVWLDMRDGDDATTVHAAFSSDGGRTFGEDRAIYTSPDGHVCECCPVSVAVAEDGRVAVMFRNWLEGNRDMYVLKSIDGGRSFSEARKQGEGAWALSACPMDGGDLVLEEDEITTVWRRENRLYGSRDGFGDESQRPTREQPVATGQNASLAVGQLGTHLAFIGEGGRIMYRGALSAEAMEVAQKGQDPIILWMPRQRAALVLWEDEGKVMARQAPRR